MSFIIFISLIIWCLGGCMYLGILADDGIWRRLSRIRKIIIVLICGPLVWFGTLFYFLVIIPIGYLHKLLVGEIDIKLPKRKKKKEI